MIIGDGTFVDKIFLLVPIEPHATGPYLPGKEIPFLFGTQMYITMLTKFAIVPFLNYNQAS
jgi:hypothetical protein